MIRLPEVRLVPIPSPIFAIRMLEVQGQFFSVRVIPQDEGGFVARVTTSEFSATGQGETEEEALQDIKSAIELLMEKDSEDEGDDRWPFQ